MCYMENALDNLPERDSSGSRNASSGPLSCLSGSVTPTEETQCVSNQQQQTESSSPRVIAPNGSSSETKRQWTSSDFDVVKWRKEEELQQNTYQRQRKKSGASKSRVSFGSDLSVATSGIPPLDLSTPATSVDTTSISSCGATPDPSPRRVLGNTLLKYRTSGQREIMKTRQQNGPSSVVERSRKDSSARVLHSNISIRDKRQTSHDTSQKRYYDMDMNVLTTGTTPANENSPSIQSLKRVSSESFLPTPEAARYEDFSVRGATSLHDIRYVLDDIVSPLQSPSREEFSDYSRNLVEESSNGRENYQRKSRIMSDAPSKCQSLPNVDAIESIRDDFCSKLGRPVQKPQESVVRNSRHYLRHDSSDSLLSEAGRNHLLSDGHREQSTDDSMRIFQTKLTSEHNISGSQVDLNYSDTDSMKSFISTSSISSFRHAISAKMGTRYQASGTLRSKPVSVPDAEAKSNDSLTYARMNSNDLQTIQRPIAMVTRHTQMPSPGPQKMTLPRRK